MDRESLRIVVADDEEDLVWALRHSLGDEGYEVLTAYDGMEALALAQHERPDLFILDIMMPGIDGLEVCRRLRRDPALAAIPILFLTVRNDIEDRLTGWEEGCDDYLVKPFDTRELKARVRALLRRSRSRPEEASALEAQGSLLVVGACSLNLHARQVRLGDKTVQLTPTEFGLLHYLMLHPGQVFSSRDLLQEVWGWHPETAAPSLVRWHIKNLRTKIEPDPTYPVYIRSVPRQGYVFATTVGKL